MVTTTNARMGTTNMKTDRARPLLDLTDTELKLGLVALLGVTYALSWFALAPPRGAASTAPPAVVSSRAVASPSAIVRTGSAVAGTSVRARPARARSSGRVRTRSS